MEESTKIGTLTKTQEDCLEAILQILAEKPVARIKDIARKLGVKTPSVVDVVKRLARDGYVKYKPHEYITLNRKGRNIAQKVLARHNFLKQFFTEILGVDPKTAERDACLIEHNLSSRTMERLVAFFEFAQTSSLRNDGFIERFRKSAQDNWYGDSKGNSVFRSLFKAKAGGPMQIEEQLISLNKLAPGETGCVFRLDGKNLIRERLIDLGILPKVMIKLERVAPLGDPIEVRLRGFRLSLRKEEAESIKVLKES